VYISEVFRTGKGKRTEPGEFFALAMNAVIMARSRHGGQVGGIPSCFCGDDGTAVCGGAAVLPGNEGVSLEEMQRKLGIA